MSDKISRYTVKRGDEDMVMVIADKIGEKLGKKYRIVTDEERMKYEVPIESIMINVDIARCIGDWNGNFHYIVPEDFNDWKENSRERPIGIIVPTQLDWDELTQDIKASWGFAQWMHYGDQSVILIHGTKPPTYCDIDHAGKKGIRTMSIGEWRNSRHEK